MQVHSLGREDPEGGNGNPRQYSCLGNPMDRGAWQATVDGVAMTWTQLCSVIEHSILEIHPCCCQTQDPFILKL